MHFIFVGIATEWTQQILRCVCYVSHFVYTNIGCTNSEFYQDVSNVFVCHRCKIWFEGNRGLEHSIYTKFGTIADLLVPILAVAIYTRHIGKNVQRKTTCLPVHHVFGYSWTEIQKLFSKQTYEPSLLTCTPSAPKFLNRTRASALFEHQTSSEK